MPSCGATKRDLCWAGEAQTTRDAKDRMTGRGFGRTVAGAGIALALAVPAQALTPLPACDREERGMYVFGATDLGGYESGLLIEGYRNLNSADGVIAGADGPVPALNNFNGYRITDCRTGRAVGVHGDSVVQGEGKLLATEFLRNRAQRGDALPLRQVQRAADAIYGNDGYARVLRLRVKNETCACAEFYPGRWTK